MTTPPDYYTEDKLLREKETLTPSGRYRLLIRAYQTEKGCWSYSRGTVFRVSDNQQICDIKRNYSSFHHSFVQKGGQEYLITGRRYTSQTIVNLDTGQEFEPKVEDTAFNFCWADVQLTPDEKTLVVTGCYWAAPYEIKFFDFTDPSQGWPELELASDKHDHVPEDKIAPVLKEDGIIECRQSRARFKPTGQFEDDIDLEDLAKIKEMGHDYNDEGNNWESVECVVLKLKRQDNKMVVVDEWLSAEEVARRIEQKAAEEKWDTWMKEFRNSDPLYLEYKTLLESTKLPASNYESTGVTYGSWCSDFKEKETRWCRRIITSSRDKGATHTCPYTVDLEWAVKTGPIKLVIYKNGNSHEDRFYPHSVEGMQQAFAHAKQLFEETDAN